MTSEAYGKAYEKGFKLTIRFLWTRGCKDLSVAEEAAQQAWSHGWEKLEQLKNPDAVLAWINSIALNKQRAIARRDYEIPLAGNFPGGEAVSINELHIRKELSKVHLVNRNLFLRHLEGVSSETLASEMGLTEIAVRVRLSRVRKGLKDSFAGCN